MSHPLELEFMSCLTWLLEPNSVVYATKLLSNLFSPTNYSKNYCHYEHLSANVKIDVGDTPRALKTLHMERLCLYSQILIT